MQKVPDLIQDYARTFYEYHLRHGNYRIFSHRKRFDHLTDEEVANLLDRIVIEIIERYGAED